jgi:hypothetical protein
LSNRPAGDGAPIPQQSCNGVLIEVIVAAEYSNFAGWEKNLKLANDSVELIVTLEVGPRIISYRPVNGHNVFKLVEEEAGRSNEKEWRIRGGHRFWLGPEDFGSKESLTYAVDNSEVTHAIKNLHSVAVSHRTNSPAIVRREMVISLDRAGPGVRVEHRLTNEGEASLVAAPWALSVMVPGGYAVIPQPQLGTHPTDYVPNRAIVAWPFTDLADERLRLGRRMIVLTQKKGSPIKFGLRHTASWAAYFCHDGHLFVKSVPYIDGEIYPDLGSNFEAFANSEFLELETLGPLKQLAPGETLRHNESWAVFANVVAPEPEDEEAFLEWIKPYTSQLPLSPVD